MILRRIAEHMKSQNWVAIGIDFVIVVLGVFVATQVSNWNDAVRDRQRGQEYLASIHGELLTDAAAIERRAVFWRQVTGYGEDALAYAEHGTLKDGSAWQTLLAFFQASQIWPYTATDTTYRELTGAGELGLIRDRSMRAALADYYVVRKSRLDPLFEAMPRYREDVRGLTPMNVQTYIWSNCHHSFLEGAEEMQELIACDSPISEAEAREILRSYMAAPEIVRGLRFWMSTNRVYSDLSAHDRDTAIGLAERINAEAN
ncbi:MAG: hypothetical protein NT015_00785 [Alphaproteobacteria bacterium]|nr:hypothetical protein [Alphaproteobacteria bacterium]